MIRLCKMADCCHRRGSVCFEPPKWIVCRRCQLESSRRCWSWILSSDCNAAQFLLLAAFLSISITHAFSACGLQNSILFFSVVTLFFPMFMYLVKVVSRHNLPRCISFFSLPSVLLTFILLVSLLSIFRVNFIFSST